MVFFEWDPSFSVGIAEIDQQHKKIVDFINQLNELILPAGKQDALRSKMKELSAQASVIAEMVEYSSNHFSIEEKFMRQYTYPDYEKHKKEHDYFIAKVQTFKSDFDKGKGALSNEVMQFLKMWLRNHILKTDKEYEPFFRAKGLK